MKTLETDQELLKGLQRYQRQQRRTPEPTYHPIGLLTDAQMNEYQKGCYEMLQKYNPTFYITFVFQRKFSNQNIEQVVTYGKQKLHKFHKYIHRKLLGKYWYKPEMVNPQEHIKMCLFPEKITTHPHYCGIVEVKNTKMFPRKVEMFLEHSNPIWTTNKILPRKDGLSYEMFREYATKNKINPTKGQHREIKKLMEWDKDVLVPNGHVNIETINTTKEQVCSYSVKEQRNKNYYGHYYVSGVH
jgi:hypothetical protein